MNLKQYIDGSCEELKMPEDDSYKIKQLLVNLATKSNK